MDKRDHELGMGREISRRDFLNGVVATAAALGAGCGPAEPDPPVGLVGHSGKPPAPDSHPPSRLGLRGSHEGAFEVAHQLGIEKRTDWGPARDRDPDEYDLVVVGAGISGLSAALFYRDQNPGARVLLLENHDDFGGHAKRNEFEWKGRTILGYGGSQSLEAPSNYSDEAIGLLERIGVEKTRLRAGYDTHFLRRHGLGAGLFFDRASYGVDRLIPSDLIDPSAFIPVARSGVSDADAVAQMPISEEARRELLRLIEGGRDRLPDHSILSEPGYLQTITYKDLLIRHLGVKQPEVIALLQDLPSGYFGQGIDVIPALEALGFGLPGLASTSLGSVEGLIRRAISWAIEPYHYHFPDGNASVARLLVRELIPDVSKAEGMESVLTARFDYGQLDRADAEVRLRLGSTVVRVAHEGDPQSATRVDLTYVRKGRTERVRARNAVLACYNMVIPYLCPELPAAQKEALRSLVKTPLVYTSVLLRNWRAFEQLGVGVALCPGSWHQMAMLDFPMSLGAYRFSNGPDDPIVVHMSKALTHPGLTPREQSRAGRHELLDTSFEMIERETRTHLGGMLGEGGFDPGRDIEALAVNRWLHGYSFTPNPIFDPKYDPGKAPHEIGRRRFGRITIANSDAGARAYLDCAIDEAWRAVGELST
jgi:spermidine dehydrogenase